ncbi:cytochrome b, partial [Pseudomonas syringae pv. tagetis]
MDSLTSHRYTARSRWLHWLMAIMILLAYALNISLNHFGKGSEYRTLLVQS